GVGQLHQCQCPGLYHWGIGARRAVPHSCAPPRTTLLVARALIVEQINSAKSTFTYDIYCRKNVVLKKASLAPKSDDEREREREREGSLLRTMTESDQSDLTEIYARVTRALASSHSLVPLALTTAHS